MNTGKEIGFETMHFLNPIMFVVHIVLIKIKNKHKKAGLIANIHN